MELVVEINEARTHPFYFYLIAFTALIVYILINLQVRERFRQIFLILNILYSETSTYLRKFYLILQIVFLCTSIMLIISVLTTFVLFILFSSNAVEFLNNTLTVLIIDQLDNMCSQLFINWLNTNFNSMTRQDSFMIFKSSHSIENYLFSTYIAMFIWGIKIMWDNIT